MGPLIAVAGKTNTSLVVVDYGTVDCSGRENNYFIILFIHYGTMDRDGMENYYFIIIHPLWDRRPRWQGKSILHY